MLRKRNLFATVMTAVFLSTAGTSSAEPGISGLFSFQYKDGGRSATYDATLNHNGSQTFAVGQMTLFLDGNITPDMFYTGEIQSDLFSNNPEENQFKLRSGAVTMTNLGKQKTNLRFGKFDTIIGSFSERRLVLDNPLFDAPLAYSHRVNLDPSAGFVTPSVLMQRQPVREIGIIDKEMTQTGVQVFGSVMGTKLNYALALTNNPASNNQDVNVNNALTPSLKLHWIADPNLNFGFSFAQGGYLNDLNKVDSRSPEFDALYGGSVTASKANPSAYKNTILNLFLNYKMNRFDFHTEFFNSTYEVPNLSSDLTAQSIYAEAKYNFSKYFFGAVRLDSLTFGSDKYRTAVDIANNQSAISWDNDVTRLEMGLGNYINENTLTKITYQANDYEESPSSKKDFNLIAGSISVIF
jgi:hypothetical protein